MIELVCLCVGVEITGILWHSSRAISATLYQHTHQHRKIQSVGIWPLAAGTLPESKTDWVGENFLITSGVSGGIVFGAKLGTFEIPSAGSRILENVQKHAHTIIHQ